MRVYLLAISALLSLLFSSTVSHSEEISEPAQLPLEELRTFTQVFDQIRQAYVEEIDDKALLENAIIGMLGELDPHSTYLNKEGFEILQEHSTGEFGGLGMEVGMENGLLKVIAPIDDTPADRAGIRSGDLIIQLDEQLVQGMSLQESIEVMRGPKGSTIKLTILRKTEDKPLVLEITRDLIQIRSVRHRLLEPGYGYIRIAQFQEKTGEDFVNAINALKQDDSSLNGLVLDLRNNPGGLLRASIDVADTLLDDGIIVSTQGRIASSNNIFAATLGDLLEGLPVIVIINAGSASAAEIVAGALQDNGRALIIGTTSFGKGSVQTVLPISEGRAIKLTTARYFTPDGNSIQAEGINPDISIQDAELRPVNGQFIKEKQLAGHLDNRQNHENSQADGSDLSGDHQLYEALNLLKATSILGRNKEK